MEQLANDMEEIEKVPGRWREAKQMEKLQREENLKSTTERH